MIAVKIGDIINKQWVKQWMQLSFTSSILNGSFLIRAVVYIPYHASVRLHNFLVYDDRIDNT